jgi:hypothetical protein
MAITNEQVLAEVSSYRSENGRPCPANHLVAKFGDEVLDTIASLKKNGTLIGKRGRTGGLVPADAAPATTTEAATSDESVADQFAALAARLAESEQTTDVAVG